ncbi:hypothetical protein MAFF211520_06270 [Ralstonia pseudosolanacearum]|nr:hypothetical protein MAFF211520_06270 [Ralstonia pseudosolanacearum]BEU55572.1 hypothetical protein MAFF211521_06250 [Ralstonia pseudosolanacearum]
MYFPPIAHIPHPKREINYGIKIAGVDFFIFKNLIQKPQDNFSILKTISRNIDTFAIKTGFPSTSCHLKSDKDVAEGNRYVISMRFELRHIRPMT